MVRIESNRICAVHVDPYILGRARPVGRSDSRQSVVVLAGAAPAGYEHQYLDWETENPASERFATLQIPRM